MKIRLRPLMSDIDDLDSGKSYLVVGIDADEYRVVNERGEPHLYPADLFEVVDPREPAEWVSEVGLDGARYAYPAELREAGFFEAWFDGDPVAVATFARYLARNPR